MAWTSLLETDKNRFDWQLEYPRMPDLEIDVRRLNLLLNSSATSHLQVKSTAGERHRGVSPTNRNSDGSISGTFRSNYSRKWQTEDHSWHHLDGFDAHSTWYQRELGLDFTAITRALQDKNKSIYEPKTMARFFDKELRRAFLRYGYDHTKIQLNLLGLSKSLYWFSFVNMMSNVALSREELSLIWVVCSPGLELFFHGIHKLQYKDNPIPRRLDIIPMAEPVHLIGLLTVAALPRLVRPAKS